MRNANSTDQDVSSNNPIPWGERVNRHARANQTHNSHRPMMMAHLTSGEDVTMRGLLTVKEAAAWLAISPATCYRLMERGTLRSLKIGGARRVRLSDLQELIAHEI